MRAAAARKALLRALGFAVAAVVLAAATQLILLSFEAKPLLSQQRVEDIAGWIQRPAVAGAALLTAVFLGVLTVWLCWGFVRSFGTDQRVLKTRRKAGSTKIDRASLEAAFARKLEQVDRRNDIRINITRRGRVDAQVVTPDPTISGPVRELRDAIDEMCGTRHLPCHSGRVTATVPRRTTARRRVR